MNIVLIILCSSDVNVCDAVEVGFSILKSMMGKPVKEIKFKRNSQCKEFRTCAVVSSPSNTNKKTDVELLFHR